MNTSVMREPRQLLAAEVEDIDVRAPRFERPGREGDAASGLRSGVAERECQRGDREGLHACTIRLRARILTLRTDTLGPMRIPLSAEILAARAAGGLSRLVRTGGGTTIPGKLLWKLDPGAIDRLAARLPLGSLLLSATNGKTTTAAMVAEIMHGKTRLAHNRAGANLVSGVASALLDSHGAELGLFEVDAGAFPEVSRRLRPRAVCLANLFRDQLDRYGELELVAERWRDAVGLLPDDSWVVVNGDDPQTGDLAHGSGRARVFGIDDPRRSLPALPHAADSRYCIRCGTPYDFAAAYMGHLGDYRCPHCGHSRPPLDVVARAIELEGLNSGSFELEGSAVQP